MKAELVCIDGDILAYRAAAACEKRSIVVTHRGSGREKEFDTRTEFKKSLEGSKWTILDFDVVDKQEAENPVFAKHSVKTTINSICEACGTDNYHIVMSGKGNFRLDLPLPTRYKSNRSGMTKPLLLPDVRDYLVQHHAAEVTEGVEADDVLCEYAYTGFKEGRIIVQSSIDKDALSNMGYVYDWTKMEKPIYISGIGNLEESVKKVTGTGRKWFAFQQIVGDVADGFKPTELCGIKYGEKSAYKLLNDLKTDKEIWQAVYNQYKVWYPEPVTYKAWDGTEYTKDAAELLQLYTDCCHMRRWKNDRVVVKDVLTKLKIDF